jgi:hypothetical protein
MWLLVKDDDMLGFWRDRSHGAGMVVRGTRVTGERAHRGFRSCPGATSFPCASPMPTAAGILRLQGQRRAVLGGRQFPRSLARLKEAAPHDAQAPRRGFRCSEATLLRRKGRRCRLAIRCSRRHILRHRSHIGRAAIGAAAAPAARQVVAPLAGGCRVRPGQRLRAGQHQRGERSRGLSQVAVSRASFTHNATRRPTACRLVP